MIGILNQAAYTIEQVKDEEQESLGNMPENFECSERYAVMENAVDVLEDCIEKIGEVQSALEEII